MRRSGSETLSKQDTSRQATLTNDRSLTCNQTTCGDMSNAISSQELADGASRSDGREFQTTQRCGPAPVHVSRFRARDAEKAMPTNDTSGPLFSALSPSANLQWCLGSKLQARMAGNGSPLYALIWSQWDMQSGPPICRLRASALRTSDSDCGGWPTPRANDAEKRGNIANDPRNGLPAAVRTYPTPIARDSRTIAGAKRAPNAIGTEPLVTVVAEMEGANIGGLNPLWVAWLMGFPQEHISCAPTETPSFLKSRRNLSKHQSKQSEN